MPNKRSHDEPSIGVAECVRRTGLTARALRVYEREGLISPSRSANGWRIYTRADLVRLNAIVALKSLGLSLGQIREALTGSSPALRRVLRMQRDVWQKRRTAADEGIAMVRAAIATLDLHQELSIDDLCNLARRMEMSTLQQTTREVINATISPDEERTWLTWWASRPREEIEVMQQYAAAQRVLLEQFAALQAAGASPASPEVQRLVPKWHENLSRYGGRSRILEMMAWNTPLTRKWLRVGERVISRTVGDQQKGNGSIWPFLRSALKASPLARASEALLAEARSLVRSGAAPAAAQGIALARRLRELSRQHDLGDPAAYGRWCCAMGTLSESGESVDLEPADRAAWEYLIQASERISKS